MTVSSNFFVDMGKLSSYTGKEDASEPSTSVGQKQGTFRSLAIRNSPHLGEQTILPLFDLIGMSQTVKPILASLRILDLSGNELGDEICSRLLSLAHDNESGCSLEQLDLSKNLIGKGTYVWKVFLKYAKDHRYDLFSGVDIGKRSWCSKLHTLNLADNLHPFKTLDFKMERELISGCLKEASRDIELSFDNATHDRLLATLTKRCGCLHYSDHGHEHYLPFEDGTGGPHWLQIDHLKQLIKGSLVGAPFKFVFVSACHSGLAGETFARAGVPNLTGLYKGEILKYWCGS